MKPAMTTIISTIAPLGVPYFAETDASPPGRRRSRAIANTPRVDAVAAPTQTARMSSRTTTIKIFRIASDP